MPNRLYNKQVSVKGYSTGGRIEKVPGGYSKEGSGRISDKGLKGRSPTEAFKQKEMFKGSSKGMRVKKKEGGRTKKMTESQKQAAKDAPKKIKKVIKTVGKLLIPGAAAADAMKKFGSQRLGKKMGGSLKPVPADNKGLKKLPTQVRNKMGYMKKGGKVK
jgi:hypothetical protein